MKLRIMWYRDIVNDAIYEWFMDILNTKCPHLWKYVQNVLRLYHIFCDERVLYNIIVNKNKLSKLCGIYLLIDSLLLSK